MSAQVLTPRQHEVLHLIAEGHTNRQIATLLGITEDTVANHSKAIRDAFNAKGRAHAVAQAFRAGVLSADYFAEVSA